MTISPKMTMHEFTLKAVGLPFVDGGRDWKGVDCWGCVVLCFRECLGIELPSYGDTSALDLAAIAGIIKDSIAGEPWVAVLPFSVQPFDVAVMHRRSAPVHVGIMVSNKMVLHIEEKTSAVMVPLTHDTVAFRYPRFFRHRQLVDTRAA